jgi:hypothetical protein
MRYMTWSGELSMSYKIFLLAATLSVLTGSAADSVSGYLWMAEPVEFYSGHTHAGHTHGINGEAP